jgi:chromodomain-helicase-DNA-binding protein 1
MFKSDAEEQSKKLAAMDLDDILNRAEDHETEGTIDPGGASLGGEAFLNSFAAVQDIRAADLSWDDIIPADTRDAVEAEEREKAIAIEDATLSRKRAAAQLPGAYSGMMDEEPEPESSRRGESSKRATSEVDQSHSPGGSVQTGKTAGRTVVPKKTAIQKSLELKGESSSLL